MQVRQGGRGEPAADAAPICPAAMQPGESCRVWVPLCIIISNLNWPGTAVQRYAGLSQPACGEVAAATVRVAATQCSMHRCPI